jgi:hypothetical protein
MIDEIIRNAHRSNGDLRRLLITKTKHRRLSEHHEEFSPSDNLLLSVQYAPTRLYFYRTIVSTDENSIGNHFTPGPMKQYE